MPKAYVFTARKQIDDLLKEYSGLWFSLPQIKLILEQEGKTFSTSTIRRSLKKSQLYRGVARQLVSGIFYYRSRRGAEGVGHKFLPPCTCYIAAIEDYRGYLGGEDDCPIHSFQGGEEWTRKW